MSRRSSYAFWRSIEVVKTGPTPVASIEIFEPYSPLTALNQTAVALAHHVRNALAPMLMEAQVTASSRKDSADFAKRVIDQSRYIEAVTEALLTLSEEPEDIQTKPYIEGFDTTMLDIEALIDKHLAVLHGEAAADG